MWQRHAGAALNLRAMPRRRCCLVPRPPRTGSRRTRTRVAFGFGPRPDPTAALSQTARRSSVADSDNSATASDRTPTEQDRGSGAGCAVGYGTSDNGALPLVRVPFCSYGAAHKILAPVPGEVAAAERGPAQNRWSGSCN